LAGIVLIGATNLIVSFALALYVAMKSKRLGVAQLWTVARVLVRQIATDPRKLWRSPGAHGQ